MIHSMETHTQKLLTLNQQCIKPMKPKTKGEFRNMNNTHKKSQPCMWKTIFHLIRREQMTRHIKIQAQLIYFHHPQKFPIRFRSTAFYLQLFFQMPIQKLWGKEKANASNGCIRGHRFDGKYDIENESSPVVSRDSLSIFWLAFPP